MSYEVSWSIQLHPIGEMESSNEGLTAVFRSLQLVEKPVELVHFRDFGLVQWIEGDKILFPKTVIHFLSVREME